jgi:hypothetical protein
VLPNERADALNHTGRAGRAGLAGPSG